MKARVGRQKGVAVEQGMGLPARGFAPEPATAPASQGRRTPTLGHTLQAPEQVDRPGALPWKLRSSIEALSGVSMDGVRVHLNSPHPDQVDAAAYTQGDHIHVAQGQEHYLPHEAWHVVQQRQRRVLPTGKVANRPLNDSDALEREADHMGRQALRSASSTSVRAAVPGGGELASAGTAVQRASLPSTADTPDSNVTSAAGLGSPNGNEEGRVVQRGVRKAANGKFYSTHDGQSTRQHFDSKHEAYALDRTLKMYQHLHSSLNREQPQTDPQGRVTPGRQMSRRTRARLQRMRPGEGAASARHFNGWVPEDVRQHPTVVAHHDALLARKQAVARDATIATQSSTEAQLKFLEHRSVPGVERLRESVEESQAKAALTQEQGDAAFAAGYRHQLRQHLEQYGRQELEQVEPRPDLQPSRGKYEQRGDALLVQGLSQEPGDHFVPLQGDSHNLNMDEQKLGYQYPDRDATLTEQLKKYGKNLNPAVGMRYEFNKRSTSANRLPDLFEKTMKEVSPDAFPGGLTLMQKGEVDAHDLQVTRNIRERKRPTHVGQPQPFAWERTKSDDEDIEKDAPPQPAAVQGTSSVSSTAATTSPVHVASPSVQTTQGLPLLQAPTLPQLPPMSSGPAARAPMPLGQSSVFLPSLVPTPSSQRRSMSTPGEKEKHSSAQQSSYASASSFHVKPATAVPTPKVASDMSKLVSAPKLDERQATHAPQRTVQVSAAAAAANTLTPARRIVVPTESTQGAASGRSKARPDKRKRESITPSRPASDAFDPIEEDADVRGMPVRSSTTAVTTGNTLAAAHRFVLPAIATQGPASTRGGSKFKKRKRESTVAPRANSDDFDPIEEFPDSPRRPTPEEEDPIED